MQKYIRMKGFVWQKQVFGKGRQDNVQIIKFINKKSRNNPTFLFWSNFISQILKSAGLLQTKNNKKNKFAIPTLFDPKTTNQFDNKNTNYSTKYSLKNKLSVLFYKLTECKYIVIEIKKAM